MPRFRALFLLGLFVANRAACTSWQVPKVTPQEYVAQQPDSTVAFVIEGRPTYEQRSVPRKMRLTLQNEHGNPPSKVVLAGVRFSEDSVYGRSRSQPVAYSLRHVTMFEVHKVDGVRTVFAVLGIGLLVLVAGAAISCATTESIACLSYASVTRPPTTPLQQVRRPVDRVQHGQRELVLCPGRQAGVGLAGRVPPTSAVSPGSSGP